jgi:Zn-dependent protease
MYMLSQLALSDKIIVIVFLLVSLAFHEAMHAYTAHRLGDNTAADEGRLTLNPIKHVDLYTTILLPSILILVGLPPILAAKPVPFDPRQVKYGEYGAALVALAGPFTNLGLAVLAAIAVRLGLVGDGMAAHVTGLFMLLNVSLFVFNMIPIPPLDGSRLLYAFAPEPIQKIMEQIEAIGFFLIIGILLVLSPFIGPLLSNITYAILNFLV